MGQNTNTFLIKFFFFCYCPPFIIRTLGLLPNSHYTDLVPLTGFLTWSLAQIQFDCVEFIIPKCPFGILIVLGWLFSFKKKKSRHGENPENQLPFCKKVYICKGKLQRWGLPFAIPRRGGRRPDLWKVLSAEKAVTYICITITLIYHVFLFTFQK